MTINWKTIESCLCAKARFDLAEESEGVPSKTGGVKFEISFISHTGRVEAEGERIEVKLQRKQPAAERKRCSSSECIKLGVASACENKWPTKEEINRKLQSGWERDNFPSALPPAPPHYATGLQLRLVFYCLCVPRITSETEYLFLKTGCITSSNSSCWQRLWMFKTEAIPSLEHRLKSKSANVATTEPLDCLRFAFKVPYTKFSSLPGKSQ